MALFGNGKLVSAVQDLTDHTNANSARTVAAIDELRKEVNRLRDRIDNPAAGTPTPHTNGEDADTEQYHRLLDLAAGVAYADIVCHRDTWAFLLERASATEHFRVPAGVEEDDGMVQAEISGRTLIAAVDALWEIRRGSGTHATTRAIAGRLYDRISEALQNLEPADSMKQKVTRIVIDNRPPDSGAYDSTSGQDTTTD